ncbi:MAG: hypothetical protein V5A30_01290 [Haloarculaceae archaeon]
MATSDSPLANVRRRFRTALAESRLRTALAAAADTSRTLAVPGILGRAAAHARVTRDLRAVKRWGRQSFLYRWLTKEPDPSVVVIDLRETYTVGPVIAVLDRFAVPLGRSYRASGLQRLADEAAGVASALAATRVGQALGRALAPPEPPDAPSTGETPAEDPSETGSDAGSEEPPEETADASRTDPD